MSLIDSPKLKPGLIDAHLEPCLRTVKVDIGESVFTELQEERFRYVVETDTDDALATVTDQYALVTNADFLSAVDLVADELGIEFDPQTAKYVNGRGYFWLQVPHLAMSPDGDASKTVFTIALQNDYRGGGSIKILAGWFRLACDNGLIVGEIASRDTKRHVGDINIYEWVKPALEKIIARFEVEKLVAEELANTRFYASSDDGWRQGRKAAVEAVKSNDATLVDQILADTADRYHNDLRVEVNSYEIEIGENLWALSQAISDVSTHRMQETAKGDARTKFNAAADEWATRQFNRIRKYAGV